MGVTRAEPLWRETSGETAVTRELMPCEIMGKTCENCEQKQRKVQDEMKNKSNTNLGKFDMRRSNRRGIRLSYDFLVWYCRLWSVFWSKLTAASELKEQKETNRELLESAQLLGQAALEAESQVGPSAGRR